MWRTDLLTDAAEAALRSREAALREEQAVHGLDALDEVGLHPVLAGAYKRAGLGILREQPYPQEWAFKVGRRGRGMAELPERRDRNRCDLVILAEPDGVLVDPLMVQSAVLSNRKAAEATLFESVAAGASPAIEQAAKRGLSPEDAYWLEVKVVGQHTFNCGVPGPNRSYASELRRSLADLRKLDDDRMIRHAGLMLVLFTEAEETARHDVTALAHACLDRELPVASPEIRCLPIRERIGNNFMTLALLDLRKPLEE